MKYDVVSSKFWDEVIVNVTVVSHAHAQIGIRIDPCKCPDLSATSSGVVGNFLLWER